jgi:hypothetical protein
LEFLITAEEFISLLSILEEGMDPSSIEAALTSKIEELPKEGRFVEIGVKSAFRIFSRVPHMNSETVKTIISLFFDRYGSEFILLTTSIDCGSIGEKAKAILCISTAA